MNDAPSFLVSLASLLESLDGVRQSPRYHPEGDALFHSLQVFELARRESEDPVLWAAALFHDVGKAIDGPLHDEVGADLLEGLLCPRAVWLVRHHLDLLKDPRATRRRYLGTPALRDLERLRRWDLGGRDPRARVLSIEGAFDQVFADETRVLDTGEDEHDYDDRAEIGSVEPGAQ
jgi:HD superfamily phosphodiesterase